MEILLFLRTYIKKIVEKGAHLYGEKVCVWEGGRDPQIRFFFNGEILWQLFGYFDKKHS